MPGLLEDYIMVKSFVMGGGGGVTIFFLGGGRLMERWGSVLRTLG